MGKLLIRLRRRLIHLIPRSMWCTIESASPILSVKICRRRQRHTFHLSRWFTGAN